MDNIIELNQVIRSYTQGERTFTALNGIELEIKQGEYIAIVGKSGSGKSTMLNLITGIDHPTSGVVTVIGTDIHQLNESQLAQWRGKNIGIVFQFFQLIPTLTIIENILLAMEFVKTIPRNERLQRAKNLLEMVSILDHANKFPAGLSGGEQQRAAIARALANDPDILVADEPTGNLDSATADSVKAIFADLVAKGKTVIVVTHANVGEDEFDRVIRLQDGEIISSSAKSSGQKGQS
ncbi:MAG: ABC transporter ATP-binding protein [Xanthomonadales bacterium]|nr:ABC transporter ATP-binding protein [Xanthomonadales bacterium]